MKLIILNHKLDLGYEEVLNFEKELSEVKSSNRIVMCPKSKYLKYFKNSNYELGSRNVDDCLSISELKDLGVKYTLVAHSERNDSISKINNDLVKLIENNIIPILCVGEEVKGDQEVIFLQLDNYLKDLKSVKHIIIAYEPIWAIGSGALPKGEEVEEIINQIKKYMLEKYQTNSIVIYGGSVSLEVMDKLKQINIDGYILGGLSLDIENLKIFIKEME